MLTMRAAQPIRQKAYQPHSPMDMLKKAERSLEHHALVLNNKSDLLRRAFTAHAHAIRKANGDYSVVFELLDLMDENEVEK